MSPRQVVPVRSLSVRLPDAGRIRIGIKVPTRNGKTRPEKIDRFRFTSQDRTAIEQVAGIYGGQITEWSDPKAAPGQWQVITDANELNIALPPDPLGNSPVYELWSGGGNQRRCDGEQCEMLTQGPDGLDLQQVPCICDRKGVLECSLWTRLSVLLPDVRFGGVWRLDTKGHNAAAELPGMVDLIRQVQERGIQRATLRVEWRKQAVAGQTREFAVPVLGLDSSLHELAAGMSSLTALGASVPVAGEIGAGNGQARDADPAPVLVPADPDDEVVEAEFVDDDGHDAAVAADERGVTKADIGSAATAAFKAFTEVAPHGHVTAVRDRLRRAVIWHSTGGRTASLSECDPKDLVAVYRRLTAIVDGRVVVDAAPLADDGDATFRWQANGHEDAVTVRWSEFEAGVAP